MENTEIHYEMQVKNLDYGNIWNEKITGLKTKQEYYEEPRNDEDALIIARKTISFFNKTLRPGEVKRKLVCVQRIETKVIDLMKFKP